MNELSDNLPKKICFLRSAEPDDDGAFTRALRLCRSTGAELNILSVLSDPPTGFLRLLSNWSAPTEAITGETEASAAAERLIEIARGQGVHASHALLRGNRALEASQQVLRNEYDLLIKAAEPTHAIQRVLLGHTDRQLIRKCPCTVWIEKPSSGESHDRILAAVDPAPFRDEQEADPVREHLNTSILQYARLLAQIENAELHVAHVWSFDIEMSLRSRAGLDDKAVAEVGQSLLERHEWSLAQLLAPYRQEITRVHLLKGHAGEEISRFAASESIDVIVMGTLCRSGLGGLMIGNTAETVLDHATCSIVALKPQGFVSPFQP